MKALLVSDVESRALWDFYRPERVDGVDVIISCGDLKKEYLEFLVTMTNKPVLYVPGNHDARYASDPPGGCENLDDAVYVFRGVRFLGLGGCKKYNSESPYQFTEEEMARRIRHVRRQIRKAGGVDVVVTHAAPTGCGDKADIAHRGFDCFLDLMDRWRPAYFLHGHVHMNYDPNVPRIMEYADTRIVNAFERFILDIPEPAAPSAREGYVSRRRVRERYAWE